MGRYGQLFIDKDDKVRMPGVKLNDGSSAWDWGDFYKDLSEGSIALWWTGDWDGSGKKMRPGIRTQNSQ